MTNGYFCIYNVFFFELREQGQYIFITWKKAKVFFHKLSATSQWYLQFKSGFIINKLSIIFVIPKIVPFNGLDKFWICLNVTNNILKAVFIFSYSILNDMYIKYSDSQKCVKLTGGSIHLISTAKWHFFNPTSGNFLILILYLHQIQSSKSRQFQVLTPSHS